MAFDYKKEYKEFYLPKNKPTIIEIPTINYVAVKGKGNPNDENSQYKQSIELLYGIAYTIKMSKKTDKRIDGYFDFVVPPLEGLWWQDETELDYNHKEKFNFISMIRLPYFIKKDDFDWAVKTATQKKKKDFSKAEFFTLNEGICVQCMHIGSYDKEPETIDLMNKFIEENNYETDLSEYRRHHEIYLSDPRKCSAEKLKTVLRIPIKKKTNE
ncbi:MAG: GyrI-like domain-containing protein [Bacteroidales bacterium]|nr:GyrI-like domain-containing protein [Bacteroidales bacterium]